MHPYSIIDTTAAWKKLSFILSDRSDFHMIDNLSFAVHAFTSHISVPFSVDETQLPNKSNLSASFREPPFSVEVSPFWLKHMYSVLSAFTYRPMPSASCYRRCRRNSAWIGVFIRSAMSSTYSASVIVFVGYCLPLAFFRVKQFSLSQIICTLSLYIYIYISIYICMYVYI